MYEGDIGGYGGLPVARFRAVHVAKQVRFLDESRCLIYKPAQPLMKKY
jgi:hypothetical protein